MNADTKKEFSELFMKLFNQGFEEVVLPQVERIDTGIEDVKARLDRVESRLDMLDRKMDRLADKTSRAESSLRELDKGIRIVKNQTGQMQTENKSRIDEHNTRLQQLETGKNLKAS